MSYVVKKKTEAAKQMKISMMKKRKALTKVIRLFAR